MSSVVRLGLIGGGILLGRLSLTMFGPAGTDGPGQAFTAVALHSRKGPWQSYRLI